MCRFTNLTVAVLDGHDAWTTRLQPRHTRAIPSSLLAYTNHTNGYPLATQFSADAVVAQLRSRSTDKAGGGSLLPSALALIGLVSVDLYSAKPALAGCNFLWAHGEKRASTAAAAPKQMKPGARRGGRGRSGGGGGGGGGGRGTAAPLSFGVLSLSRGGGTAAEPWIGSSTPHPNDEVCAHPNCR